MKKDEVLKIVKEYLESCGGDVDFEASEKRMEFIRELGICLECGDMNDNCYCSPAYDI